jgi:hypothetical protein
MVLLLLVWGLRDDDPVVDESASTAAFVDPAVEGAPDTVPAAGPTAEAPVAAVAVVAAAEPTVGEPAAGSATAPPADAEVTFMNRTGQTIVELQYRTAGDAGWTQILRYGARIEAAGNYPVTFGDLAYPVSFRVGLEDGAQFEQSLDALAAETMLSIQQDEAAGTLVLKVL